MAGEHDRGPAPAGRDDEATGALSRPESGDAEPPPGPVPPLGPRLDPVFPSFPAAGGAPAPVEAETSGPAAAVPLAHGIFTLTPLPEGTTRAELLGEAFRLADAPVGQRLSQFDQPEKDRVYGLVTQFFDHHVRRITKGVAIRTESPQFGVGTIVVAEDQLPTTTLRHATLQWAVSSAGVVALRDTRLPVSHLGRVAVPAEPHFGSPHRGDDSDLAFLLAFVCELLGVDAPQPIAATGTIALHTNDVVPVPDVESRLDAARADGMADVVLARSEGKVDGEHAGIRYWPVRDVNEAVFSLLSAMSGATIVPDIVRRAVTKQTYSWGSLALILLAVAGYGLAAAFGRQPPVAFARYLLGVIVLLVVGSFVLTHRFWRIDR